MTRRVGLIGYPVEHSLSPVFQQVAFDLLGLDVRYELWPTPPEGVAERVSGLRADDFLGANVTVPHKERAFELIEDTSEIALRAGAVNTVVNRDGHLYGHNTDAHGFLTPLRERQVTLSEANVVILGAGGAARGVAVALQSAGCERIIVANRTVERAADLAESLGGSVEAAPLDPSLAGRLRDATMLVNATAIGWEGDRLPLDASLLGSLPDSALIYDLTYRETPFLRAAGERGLATLDGLEMLVHQGAESFRLWTGLEPPITQMLEAAFIGRGNRS